MHPFQYRMMKFATILYEAGILSMYEEIVTYNEWLVFNNLPLHRALFQKHENEREEYMFVNLRSAKPIFLSWNSSSLGYCFSP